MSTFPDLLPALPEIFLAAAGMVLLMMGVFTRGDGTRMVSWFTIAVLLATTLAVVATRHGTPTTTFAGMFVVDDFAAFMKVLALLGTVLALILSSDFNQRERIDRFEYPILFLFAALGMMMMISANDLIALYLGLELQSLSLYVVAAFRRDTIRSSEAGLKYFVLGALSSGLLLYGASLVYGFTGTTSFAALAEIFGHESPSVGLIVGLTFVIAGLAFKVSAVPFHMWTPDVYEGAPTPVTAFFAAAPKVAAIALLMRVMIGPFGDLVVQWQQIIVLIAILSMALGAFAAINQRNIKRLMAYSSIGNVGYALIGLAAGTEIGIRGVLIYMTIYLVTTIGTFACILTMRRQGRMVEQIADLAGLSKTNPGIALALAVFMFSLAGIPPLAGFFGKLYVFLAAIEAGLYALAVIGVLTSVVGAFYYLRIVKLMYFDDAAEPFDLPISQELRSVIAVTGLIIMFFFLWPTPVLDTAAAAAASLFTG
ncbi:MAG: NADH-quinone oxidoreductase subunit NuoN [Alphaproteobacteria bacterium]|nr:NADH-quinone oxidoreductase subunit NuoN [Alphaproteobacteria bacterium]